MLLRSQSVLWRKSKLSFNAPDDVWLGSIADDMHSAVMASPYLSVLFRRGALKNKYKGLPATLRWRLFNFAVWERLYKVQSC